MSIMDCPDLHTLTNILESSWERKKKRYKESIQTVMVYSSAQELIELKKARTVVSSKLQEEVSIDTIFVRNGC